MARVQLPTGTKSADDVLNAAFQLLGCERWGGPSVNGWSKVSDYLRCPYRYYLKHQVKAGSPLIASSSLAQDIGAYTHAILAAYYAQQLPDARYPGYRVNCPSPDEVIQALIKCDAATMAMVDATRIWEPYIDHWAEDGWYAMAVEMPAGSPELHTSRYDLVVDVVDGIHDGIWIGEHKSLSPVSDIELYRLDGEILGECLSWRLSGLDNVFGPLSGVCVNVLIKGRVPTYRRLWLPVQWNRVDEFMECRMYWQSRIAEMTQTKYFPRNIYGCVARFDRCLFWDHCETLSNTFLMLKHEEDNG